MIQTVDIVDKNRKLIKQHLVNLEDRNYAFPNKCLYIDLAQPIGCRGFVEQNNQLTNKLRDVQLNDIDCPAMKISMNNVDVERHLIVSRDPIKEQCVVKKPKEGEQPNICIFTSTNIMQSKQREQTQDVNADKIIYIAQNLKDELQQTQDPVHMKQVVKIAEHYANKGSSKSFRHAVQAVRHVNPMIAGTILLSGKGPVEFFDSVKTYVDKGKDILKTTIDTSKQIMDSQKQPMSAEKKAHLQKLNKLISNNIVAGGKNSQEVLDYIENNFGLNADQLDSLRQIKQMKKSNQVDPIQYVDTLLGSIIFFMLNDIDASSKYTSSQKEKLTNPDFLQTILFNEQ